MNSDLYYNLIKDSLDKNKLKLLKNKSLLITGATGLIGSYFVDAFMCANEKFNLNLKVFVLSRNEQKIISRFFNYLKDDNFKYIIQDISCKIEIDEKIDYIFHAASNANPNLYSTEPINTLTSNFYGMINILEFAKKFSSKVIYLSSSEAYGKSNQKLMFFDEFNGGGYIDTMDSRSCYPISKIVSENLAACYKKQYGVDFCVVRICHVFGPTMQLSDNRAVSSFLLNAVNGEDILLKSTGEFKRVYCYVGDLFDAVILILNNGKLGEIYNFSSSSNLISIKDLAKMIAGYNGLDVVFDLKNAQSGGNQNEYIFMKTDKLDELGFECKYNVKRGIETTLDILLDIKKRN